MEFTVCYERLVRTTGKVTIIADTEEDAESAFWEMASEGALDKTTEEDDPEWDEFSILTVEPPAPLEKTYTLKCTVPNYYTVSLKATSPLKAQEMFRATRNAFKMHFKGRGEVAIDEIVEEE